MKVRIIGAKIGGYKAKGAGVFNLRQLCSVIIGLSLGIIVYRSLMNVLPVVLATVIAGVAGMLIVACGFLTFGSLSFFEVILRLIKLLGGGGKTKYITEDSDCV